MYVRLINSNNLNTDVEKASRLVDDLCAAAISLANSGPLGYSNFIQVRDEFKSHIEKLAGSYKHVEVE